MKNLLKPFNAENDQAHVAILTWFADNQDRRVNTAELSLMGFRHFKKGQRVWVPFSPETIARKARQLAQWGLLEKGHDTSHHTWYRWASTNMIREAKKFEVRHEMRNGVLTAVIV